LLRSDSASRAAAAVSGRASGGRGVRARHLGLCNERILLGGVIWGMSGTRSGAGPSRPSSADGGKIKHGPKREEGKTRRRSRGRRRHGSFSANWQGNQETSEGNLAGENRNGDTRPKQRGENLRKATGILKERNAMLHKAHRQMPTDKDGSNHDMEAHKSLASGKYSTKTQRADTNPKSKHELHQNYDKQQHGHHTRYESTSRQEKRMMLTRDPTSNVAHTRCVTGSIPSRKSRLDPAVHPDVLKLQEENAKLKSEIVRLSCVVEAAKTANNAKDTEIATIKSAMASYATIRENLEHQRDDYQEKWKAAVAKAEKASKLLEHKGPPLAERLSHELERRILELEAELAKAKREVNRKEIDLDVKNAQEQYHLVRIENMEAELKSKDNQIAELTKRYTSAQILAPQEEEQKASTAI